MTILRQRAPASDGPRRAQFAAAFQDVYEPLQRYVRRRAAPGDVDDIVADTLTVLWRRLDDMPPEQPLPWCYGVARRCLANHRRGAARRTALTERLGAQRPVADAEPLQTDDALDAALATLGADDREIVRLWAWEGLPPREIGVVMSMSANAVSIRLHRAKRSLAALLRPAVGDHAGGKESAMDGHVVGGGTASTPKEAR